MGRIPLYLDSTTGCSIKALLPSYFLGATVWTLYPSCLPLAPVTVMRCHWLFVLSILAAGPLANFATPLAPPWDDMRTKHTWNSVPPNWEAVGHPPAGTTINLHIALKHHHENALIDALYAVSDPRSPKYILSKTPSCKMYSRAPLLRADMARTFQRSRSLSLSHRTRTLSSSSTYGLNTMVYPPPQSQRHRAAAG